MLKKVILGDSCSITCAFCVLTELQRQLKEKEEELNSKKSSIESLFANPNISKFIHLMQYNNFSLLKLIFWVYSLLLK